MHTEAASLGLDRDRIAVGGQSAGGGLAAAVALLARDRGAWKICFQFLGIPELDHRLETPSMRAFVDTPMWDRPNAELSWSYYLGGATDEVSPYASPAVAADVSGLPPAYVTTMEFDPLRDEGVLYALRLLQAGVSVELHSYPGTFHGSGLVTTATVSKRAGVEMMDALRRGLQVPSIPHRDV
jgi:acetyl esterase/lipase